jgi:hypothetical protein
MIPKRTLRILSAVVLALAISSCTTVAKGESPVKEIAFQKSGGASVLSQNAFITDDFVVFHSTPRKVKFRIQLPTPWQVREMSILDASGRKVAEFSPVFVDPKGKTAFDLLPEKGHRAEGADSEIETLSKERVSRGGVEVIKVTQTGVANGGLSPAARLMTSVYYQKIGELYFVLSLYNTNSKTVDDSVVFSVLKSIEILGS